MIPTILVSDKARISFDVPYVGEPYCRVKSSKRPKPFLSHVWRMLAV
jgi:hypothetical protein